MKKDTALTAKNESPTAEEPRIIEEIVVEELSIDGVCGVYQPMSYRLADNVQVRKESWGLLFYEQTRHRVSFVKSGDWLYPAHFDGTWTSESIIEDIARRTGSPAEIIELSLPKLEKRLTSSRMVVNEIR